MGAGHFRLSPHRSPGEVECAWRRGVCFRRARGGPQGDAGVAAVPPCSFLVLHVGARPPPLLPWKQLCRTAGSTHPCCCTMGDAATWWWWACLRPRPHDQLLPPRPLTVSLWILTWKGKALGILCGHKAVVPQAAGDPVPLLALHWLTSFSVVPAQPVRKPSESRLSRSRPCLGRVRLRRDLGCGWGSLTLPRGCRSGPERQLRSPRCAQKGLVSLRSKCFCPAVF